MDIILYYAYYEFISFIFVLYYIIYKGIYMSKPLREKITIL